MSLEEQLRSIGKRTFVKCFATAHARNGEITNKQVDYCDRHRPDKWKDSSLITKSYGIRRIFRERNQCKVLKMCFRNHRHPKTEQEARELHARLCKK